VSKLPYLPFYVGDYLGKTQHLTTEQDGAYVLLLFALWQRGGSIPNDDRLLARLTKTGRRWGHVKKAILPFFKIKDGLLFHSRVDEEFAKRRMQQNPHQNPHQKPHQNRYQNRH